MNRVEIKNSLLKIYEKWYNDLQFDIIISKECNLNCIHCFIDKKIGQLPFELIEKISEDPIFDKQNNSKNKFVNFSGGEIFLRDDIEDIFYLFKHKAVSIGCVSNSFPINKKIAKLLYETKTSIGLSLDGPKEIHNLYRRNDLAFSEFERAVTILNEYNVDIGVICSVSKLNLKYIREIIEYCITKQIRSIRFQVVKPEGNGIEMDKNKLILNDNEKQSLFEDLLNCCGEYLSDINITGYGTFKSELIEHNCKFGLKWGDTCHSNSTPWPKCFGIDCEGNILQLHPFHNNKFWNVGHVNNGLTNIIKNYYASDKHIELIETLKETYIEKILNCKEEFIFEDLFLEDKVAEKLNKER